MNIDTIYRPFLSFFRRRRGKRFQQQMHPDPCDRILDVGGHSGFWDSTDCPNSITCLNIGPSDATSPLPPRFSYVQGDGRVLPFPDRAFDIAFSNSVIEHVGRWEDQQRFAREIRRVGRHYWVQTPNRWFIVEPHLIALLIHWLPPRLYRRLARWLSVRGWVERPDQAAMDAFLDDINLLTLRDMQALFPDATILTERFLFMPKSYIAVRKDQIEDAPEKDSHNVLGTSIAPVNMDTAVAAISRWIDGPSASCRYICVTGVHGVMEGYRNEMIRDVHNRAAMCVPDGMPLTWMGHRHGYREMNRVYGPDLMINVVQQSIPSGWSHFFYGGAPGVADDLAQCLAARFRGLKVAGTYCPPFRPLTPQERHDIVEQINDARPDVVWVGLSTPKQELLMADLSPDLNAKIMIGVGAAFDFHTGRVKQAPHWVQRIGMEWCFRLCMEPKRLWRRYLRNNPQFIYLIMLQLTGRRRFSLQTTPSPTSNQTDHG